MGTYLILQRPQCLAYSCSTFRFVQYLMTESWDYYCKILLQRTVKAIHAAFLENLRELEAWVKG